MTQYAIYTERSWRGDVNAQAFEIVKRTPKRIYLNTLDVASIDVDGEPRYPDRLDKHRWGGISTSGSPWRKGGAWIEREPDLVVGSLDTALAVIAALQVATDATEAGHQVAYKAAEEARDLAREALRRAEQKINDVHAARLATVREALQPFKEAV